MAAAMVSRLAPADMGVASCSHPSILASLGQNSQGTSANLKGEAVVLGSFLAKRGAGGANYNTCSRCCRRQNKAGLASRGLLSFANGHGVSEGSPFRMHEIQSDANINNNGVVQRRGHPERRHRMSIRAQVALQQTAEGVDVDLESEVGVCYEALRDRLAAGEWEEADNETRRLVCVLAGESAVKRKWVYFSEVKFFPVKDLQTMDNLWVAYSGGKFGFSVQRKIWNSVGMQWKPFFKKIGWTITHNASFRKFPMDFLWDVADPTPAGHLPLTNALRGTQLLEAILRHPAFDRADANSKLADVDLVNDVFSNEEGNDIFSSAPDYADGGLLDSTSPLPDQETPSTSERTLKNLGLPSELLDADYSF